VSTFDLHFGPNTFEAALERREQAEAQSSSSPSESLARQLGQLTDTELVDILRDNSSSEYIAELFARYRPLILSICVKSLRDHFEAEDVCQDVILEIWSKARQFDEKRGTVKVWIVQLAYSKSLHRRRSLAVRRFDWGNNGNGNSNGHENGNGNGSHLEGLQLSYVPEHVERLTTEKQVIKMINAFSSLPPKQQKALQLIYFEGLSIREVAEQTNESVENTRHYYYRGLKKLKEMLGSSTVGKAR